MANKNIKNTSKSPYKYIIVGMHASGKEEILKDLAKNGICVGRNFTSINQSANNFASTYTIYPTTYSSQDIESLFESQAYIFIQKKSIHGELYYEGLSLYEYDNGCIFAMSPEQFNLIPNISKDTVIVWIDNTYSNRHLRYLSERRAYDFAIQENLEKQNIAEFVDKVNDNQNVLYFNNEDPLRISAIILALVKNPELLSIFKERFM